MLAARHARGELFDLQTWTWTQLGRVPGWCLLGKSVRAPLVRVVGAVALAPSLRAWLDAPRVDALCRILGDDRVVAILDASVPGAFDVGAPYARPLTNALAASDASAFERSLASALDTLGAAMLDASLPPDLPSVESWRIGTLDEPIVAASLARRFVATGERLLSASRADAASGSA